ncbi:MAG: right-handed parallel beta-helix repeat-containing protein [Planctomycetales bacterium]|nr:right-handed parallel beta-helix repeat-containing protein [Planctomycetales bacterium]
MAVPAGARTWRVEKDFSGDFASIHNAVLACSAGDSILIGPGRYDDFHPVTAPAWNTAAIVYVTKDDLTFVGSGPESTIVGPTEMFDPPELYPAPMGIVAIEDLTATFVDIGIENADRGLYWDEGSVVVENCRFLECRDSVALICPGGGRISGCYFHSAVADAVGIFTYPPCGAVVVSGCEFANSGLSEDGLSLQGTSGVVIQNCLFGSYNGIGFSGSAGTVSGCVFSESVALGLSVSSASRVELYNNEIHGSYAGLVVHSNSLVSGNGNVFSGGQDVATIVVTTASTVQLNQNHIFHSGTRAVELRWFVNQLVEQDLTENFWGTTDTDSIAMWIQDINDDPAIHSIANIQPIASGPVSSKEKSFGSVKSLFR